MLNIQGIVFKCFNTIPILLNNYNFSTSTFDKVLQNTTSGSHQIIHQLQIQLGTTQGQILNQQNIIVVFSILLELLIVRTVRWPMMMVVFRHCWLVFGTISIALYPPPPSLFVGKTCCVLIQQHFLYFFPFSALLALEPKKAAASGLHQSGFVSKPVEADVELSSPASKAQVPFGMLRASFRRVAWVLVAWRNVPANVRGNNPALCERFLRQ
uniref:Uncharacterized protein n=1 Tax=Meloidogyne incognita TaxID=6306 RepID=A0A914LU18_MELIC